MRDIHTPNLFEEVEALGMESIHFPIKDKWIPNSMDGLIHLVETIIARLRKGLFVVIHCNGGKGRSGTVLVATLVGLGRGVQQAIDVVRQTRSGTIRNPLQIVYVKRFKSAWSKYQAHRREDRRDVSEPEELNPEERALWLEHVDKKKRKPEIEESTESSDLIFTPDDHSHKRKRSQKGDKKEREKEKEKEKERERGDQKSEKDISREKERGSLREKEKDKEEKKDKGDKDKGERSEKGEKDGDREGEEERSDINDGEDKSTNGEDDKDSKDKSGKISALLRVPGSLTTWRKKEKPDPVGKQEKQERKAEKQVKKETKKFEKLTKAVEKQAKRIEEHNSRLRSETVETHQHQDASSADSSEEPVAPSSPNTTEKESTRDKAKDK
eukprot:TRINITY_DN3380_c0_g1_i1.p2 TRINITY_DN3380_c0_g1~~TRINITY_DN3380_c0_g1_i1.p2  ORF type:complete len:384 (+),score=115.86 TRINITY_DN3380_c0_g1_i1:1324-2475(+)